MPIIAKLPGVCRGCGERYEPGAPIRKVEGRWGHARCAGLMPQYLDSPAGMAARPALEEREHGYEPCATCKYVRGACRC